MVAAFKKVKILHMASSFRWPIRVYYEDTDAGGIVFYANYLKFFERARTEWLRAAGVSQQQLSRSQGVMFVVKSTAVDYHAPAKLDDELKLTVVVERLGRASVDFVQEAWRENPASSLGTGEPRDVPAEIAGPTLLASGRIRVACVDIASLRPSAIPEDVLAKIRAPLPPIIRLNNPF